MSDQRLHVFVSSKMQELALERDAIKAALDEMEIDTFVFEHDAGAQAQSIQQTFLQSVETSDLYVGVFWKGYGAYTIEEFEHARMLGMDCLIYEKREGEGASRDPELQQFLDEVGTVETGLTAKWFHTVGELRASVKKDVARRLTASYRKQRGTIKPTIYVGVPRMPNHFVGREEIMVEMVKKLHSGEDQALSAAGLAGVGKTTLAVALCRHKGLLRHFTGGVLWGGLGTRPDVASILTRWADALGGDVSGLASDAEKRQAVRDAIGTQRMLLVIDDAWDLATARLLQCGGPGCTHVLTTRNEEIAQEFAGLHGKKEIPILTEEAAYQLLCELAPAVCKEDTASARELIASLGGLPLAIELVGGYLGAPTHTKFRSQRKKAQAVMSDPHRRLQLASERLGARQAAKVNLQAVVEMSLEELDEEAVGAFYALGAFAPKPEAFELAAAEAVTQVDADALAALSVLHLVDISDEEQLSLHQVVAAVAHESMDVEAVARHRAYYLRVLNRHREDWRRIEQVYGQAKWAWEAAEEAESVMDLIWATETYQNRRGLYRDELAWYERGLKVAAAAGNRRDEARLLNNTGLVYDNLGQPEEALRYLERALTIQQESGNRAGLAKTLINISHVYDKQGRREAALQSFNRALLILENLGDRTGVAMALLGIGHAYAGLGQHKKALEYFEQALSVFEGLGNQNRMATTLNNFGYVYSEMGQHKKALGYYERALPILEEVGDRAVEATTLNNIGAAYARLGEHGKALGYYERALPILEEVGNRYVESHTRYGMAVIYRAKGKLERAISHLRKVVELDRQVQHPDLESDLAFLKKVEAEWAA